MTPAVLFVVKLHTTTTGVVTMEGGRGLVCPLTVRSVTWLSWDRVTCHESRHQPPGNILSLESVAIIIPLLHLLGSESRRRRYFSIDSIHSVRLDVKPLNDERKIFDDEKIFTLIRTRSKGGFSLSLAHQSVENKRGDVNVWNLHLPWVFPWLEG